MKSVISQFQNDSTYTKVFHWVKLISLTGASQVIIQATSLISGILIIRLLPVHEYAYYTITNTMLGTMTVLADGGISNGIVSQGGKVWQDREKLGAVLATGLKLRLKFGLISLLISIPILLYLLIGQGANWQTCMLIIAALVLAFLATMSDSVLEVVPKLHQEIKLLQFNELSVNIGRLILSGLMVIMLPLTFVALLASGIPRIYGNLKLRKITYSYITAGQQPDMKVQKEVLSIVKRTLPGAIYYCVSGQITIWLVSVIGNTASLAQIGALGRISVVLNLFITLFGTLITPRFARLPDDSKLLFTYYTRILAATLVVMCAVAGAVWLLSDQILWFLGPKYAGLQVELMLTIIGSILNLIAGITFSLYSSRGWVLLPLISLPVNMLSIIGGILIFDLVTLKGVLLSNIFIALISLLLNVSYCLYKTRNNRILI